MKPWAKPVKLLTILCSFSSSSECSVCHISHEFLYHLLLYYCCFFRLQSVADSVNKPHRNLLLCSTTDRRGPVETSRDIYTCEVSRNSGSCVWSSLARFAAATGISTCGNFKPVSPIGWCLPSFHFSLRHVSGGRQDKDTQTHAGRGFKSINPNQNHHSHAVHVFKTASWDWAHGRCLGRLSARHLCFLLNVKLSLFLIN
jgi:hypothetical protein